MNEIKTSDYKCRTNTRNHVISLSVPPPLVKVFLIIPIWVLHTGSVYSSLIPTAILYQTRWGVVMATFVVVFFILAGATIINQAFPSLTCNVKPAQVFALKNLIYVYSIL